MQVQHFVALKYLSDGQMFPDPIEFSLISLEPYEDHNIMSWKETVEKLFSSSNPADIQQLQGPEYIIQSLGTKIESCTDRVKSWKCPNVLHWFRGEISSSDIHFSTHCETVLALLWTYLDSGDQSPSSFWNKVIKVYDFMHHYGILSYCDLKLLLLLLGFRSAFHCSIKAMLPCLLGAPLYPQRWGCKV